MRSYNNLIEIKLQQLEFLVKTLSEALEFYANEKNWEDTEEVYTGEGMLKYSNISIDGGETAILALNSYKKYLED